MDSPKQSPITKDASANETRVAPRAAVNTPLENPYEPLVNEIKQRLSLIAAREVDYIERESEFELERERIEESVRAATLREQQAARERLRKRSAELDDFANELKKRRDEIAQQQADLRAAQEQLSRERETLELRDQRLKQARGLDHAKRQTAADELEREKRALAEEREAHERRTQIASQTLAAQREELDRLLADARARERDLDQRQAALDAAAEELSALRDSFESDVNAIARLQAEVEKERGLLRREREADAQRRAALEQETRQAQARRDAIVAELEQAEAVREELARERETLEQLRSELTTSQQELEALRENVAARETELAQNEQAARESREQAAEMEREARRKLDRAESRLEDLAAREANVREAELAVEVREQELSSGRERVDDRDERVAMLAAAEQQTTRTTTEAKQHPAPVRSTASILRAMALSTAAAAAVGFLAWLSQPEGSLSSVRLVIDTHGVPAKVAAEHASKLRDLAFVSSLLDESIARDGWRDASENGRANAQPIKDAPEVLLSLRGDRPREDARLLTQVAAAYAAQVNAVAAEPVLPPVYADLTQRRANAKKELAAIDEQLGVARARLVELPTPDEQSRLTEEARVLRAERDAAAEQIAAARREYEQLADVTPHGTVDPDALQRYIAADPVYQEDAKEYRLATEGYQRELAVAMAMLDDPLAAVQGGMQRLSATLIEQLELSPPPEVAAVLEDAKTEADRLSVRVNALLMEWPTWRNAVETAKAAEDIRTIVETHNRAVTTIQAVRDEMEALADGLSVRGEAMNTETGGGTRQVVVAAILKSEGQQLASANTRLATAAQAVSYTENIELDAQSRKLRALRTRLARREETLQGHLQRASDAAAAELHADKIDTARRSLITLEDQREARFTRLVELLDKLDALAAPLSERMGVETTVAALDREAQRLRNQVADLDGQLLDVERGATRPDRIDAAPEGVVQAALASDRRLQSSGAAAGAAWVFTLLACLLVSGRRMTDAAY